ncbi:P-loop containing nucleoside triphosphate hydrolase [Cinara cedri]|uniref:P-loop containing nucleoside triphosphate hydrolase n=1 Tax=Cinara cedri TaxID=506608 RepID=A0A5E4MDW3_9HEMI|nr:P-loop containing nucleoside triphosphate hydrolase [Cinara cedri]
MNFTPQLSQKIGNLSGKFDEDSDYNDKDWYNGSIKSITLENFMCHSNFHLTLNPRINFISGLNGSGKSAIQTALVIGFGARASITNRADSLKKFIKYGCSSATIAIKIANGGIGSYESTPFKPEVYGKEITIVRQITESGSVPYKFLNENGRIVKASKNELKSLTLHFNILVENPICVMNQNMVKTFHKSANPNAKYDLFYKAISGNIYEAQIEKTKSVANEYSDKLQNVESVLNQCFKEVNEYEIYEKKNQRLGTLRNKKMEFQNEYAWGIISEYEQNYKSILSQIEVQKNNMSGNTEKKIELEENLKTCLESLEIKKDALKNMEDSRTRNHFIYMDTKKELKEKTNECEIQQNVVRKYQNSLNSLINDRKEFERHIEIERQKGNTNSLAQIRAKLSQCEENIAEVEAAWKTNMEHEQTLRNTIDDLKQRMGQIKDNNISPIQRTIIEINRNIKNMSQQQDKIHFYGNWMPNLVENIEIAFKQRKFIKKPIGPIGAYIKVNNNKWIFSIENHLGRGNLKTFLVDNFADNKVLQSIMNKTIPSSERKPTVITSKFFDKVHDISTKKTTNSMFDMLTFTSPAVANCLIDNNRIEKIMLIDDTIEAMPLMENVSRVPRNCNFSLTLDGTQVYPSPSYRVYALQNPSEPVLLLSDVSVAMNNLKHQKNELEKKISNLNKEFENFEQSKLENQKNLNKTQLETRLLKAKYEEYNKKINELKAKCEEDQDDRLAFLTEEINEINKKIDKVVQLKENAMEPIAGYNKEIHEITQRLHEVKSIIEKTDRSAILEQIEGFQTQIKNYQMEMSQINQNLVEQNKTLTTLLKTAEKEKEILINKTEEAQNFCEKINVTRSVEDIKTDIKEITHKYDLLKMELNKRGENYLVLRDEYKKKKEEYIRQRALYKQIVEIYQSNNKSIKLSKIALDNYVQFIKLKVIESFDLVLLIRKIKGQLLIDSQEQSMVITMFDNISTSCASGGERTFATVALIIALWSNMQLPFYSIDEYDVYMDNVNRLATTQLLMMAIEQRKNQFIFLTPQDISHIKKKHNIKIVKLKEPRI